MQTIQNAEAPFQVVKRTFAIGGRHVSKLFQKMARNGEDEVKNILKTISF